jgi:hypothetical protein
MRPIVPRHVEAPKTEIGLVHQRRRLEGMAGTLRAQMPGRNGTELRINQRQEALQGMVIPLLPGAKIFRDLFDDSMIPPAFLERCGCGHSV